MAKYRQLMVASGTGWHLMNPSGPIEALRIAWMLWRHPDRVAALVGVDQAYTLEHWKPAGGMGVAEAGSEAMKAMDRDRAEAAAPDAQ